MKSIIFVFFFVNFLNGQKIIHLNYDQSKYLKTASDTVSAILLKQNLNNSEVQEKSLSNSEESRSEYGKYLGDVYSFKDLTLLSIPVFRIRQTAAIEYDCDVPFKQFITFEERLKFQDVIIMHNSESVGSLHIPNREEELDHIISGMDFYTDFSDHYRRRLRYFGKSHSFIYDEIKANPKSFFFKIYGLDGFLFEIDNKGKMYAAYYGCCNGGCLSKLPVNEFIVKNNLIRMIKENALGFYIYDWGLPEINFKYKNCNDYVEGMPIVIESASH